MHWVAASPAHLPPLLPWISMIGFLGYGLHWARGRRRLSEAVRESVLLRSLGRVRIWISDSATTPCSWWMKGRACVLLPAYMLDRPSDFSISLAHELQHHRQGDTRWVFALQALRWAFFWNPAVHAWERHFRQFQELACDEALVGRGRISPLAYGGCLLRVAETANAARIRFDPAGTAGMASASASFLKRRIQMLINYPSGQRRFPGVVIALGTLVLLVSAAFASRAAAGEHRFTIEEVNRLAERVAAHDGFPVVVNDAVLEQLNKLLGTPDGRRFVQGSLSRLPEYQALIERKIGEYRLPEELVAVAFIESGFKNIGARWNDPSLAPAAGMRGAGLWMFLAQTARNYGLIVSDDVDERLNVEKETDAAMRYLGAMNLRFRDWGLALAAYNEGEGHVQSAINKSGVRDPWRLVQLGLINYYLPRVVAGALILNNPSILQQ
jgi:hypothetical protein